MPKLVKNSKVIKLPVPNKGVREIFSAAMKKAEDQGWDKVIIIGEGGYCGWSGSTGMHDFLAVGFLECEKNRILSRYSKLE